MANAKNEAQQGAKDVEADVVEELAETAKQQGLPPQTAKEIVDDAVSEGVDPTKLREVAEDAIQAEREDRDALNSEE